MRKLGFIIYPGYQPMGFAVTSPFETANAQAAEPVYDIRMLLRGLPGHRSTLVLARSINWEPRPSSTALIKNSPKSLASTGVVFGGRISSWRALTKSTRAGPSC
jgi:hypothetical protein